MQETLAPQRQSEDDQFADNAEEDTEEVDALLTLVSIGKRSPCYLQFADDINLLGGSEEEMQQLPERLEKADAAYGMEISSDKSKIPVNRIKQGHLPIYG